MSRYTSTPHNSRQVSLWAKPRIGHLDIINLLLSMLENSTRLDGALCVDDPALFDYDTGNPAEAADACARCPALSACQRWVETPPPGHVSGVVAQQIRKPSRYPPRQGATP